MGRVMALDYGKKRTGIATTDPLRIIANGLDTIETPKLLDWFKQYLETEVVDVLVVGEPVHKDGNPTYLEKDIQKFIKQFKELFPTISIERWDESFTSVKAKAVILNSGAKKKQRQQKELVDKISAAIILQEYLGFI